MFCQKFHAANKSKLFESHFQFFPLSFCQTNLLATETNLTQTLQVTSSVTQRANALLVRLRSLASVDNAETLVANVQQAVAGLNIESLRATLLDLQSKQTAQAEEITRLTGLKNGLQTRLNNLKVLRDQIIN